MTLTSKILYRAFKNVFLKLPLLSLTKSAKPRKRYTLKPRSNIYDNSCTPSTIEDSCKYEFPK